MAVQVKRRRGTAQENNVFTGVEGEFTLDTTNHTIRVHDGTTAGGYVVPVRVSGSAATTPGTYPKVTVNSFGFVTGGSILAESDIPTLSAYVAKNANITAATKCKVTYDTKGLVTAGADLAIGDIPTLTIAKTDGLQTALDSKQEKIPAVSMTTTIGTIEPQDNAINYVEMSGTCSVQTPTVSSSSAIHQFIIQVKKTNASWVFNLGTTKYFGGVAPTVSAAGYYNIYYEYDFNINDWVVGAIYKGAI